MKDGRISVEEASDRAPEEIFGKWNVICCGGGEGTLGQQRPIFLYVFQLFCTSF